MARQFRPLYLLLALSTAPLTVQAAPVYTVATVNGFSEQSSQANGLNNAGTVVGYAYTSGGHINAYSSSGGVVTSLHQGNPNSGNSKAWGINEGGSVVGEISVGNATQAAVFSSGTVRTLGTLGGTNSYGYAINAGGQVAGVSDTRDGSQHGFVTRANGTLADIRPINGGFSSAANAINDLGAVTGYTEIDSNGDYRAYVYANDMLSVLGTLGGNYSQGYAINNAGMVAGYSFLAGDTQSHAFLYANGVLFDLGSLGGYDSYATGINFAGDVVGVSNLANVNGGYHAFLYSGGTLKDLNDLIDPALGLTLNYAADINDKGQIAARGCRADGQCADLLLTLADISAPADVPEPSSIALLGLGLAGFTVTRRKLTKTA